MGPDLGVDERLKALEMGFESLKESSPANEVVSVLCIYVVWTLLQLQKEYDNLLEKSERQEYRIKQLLRTISQIETKSS